MKPKVQSIHGLLQLRYNLPYRIHKSLVYPLSSPNGSTIIVCGHDHGVLIVWRGGRPFKTIQKAERAHHQANGSSIEKDVLMDVDQDDTAQGDHYAGFEDEEDEFDPSKPYQPIIQELDMPLETAVLQLAAPPLSQPLQQGPEQTPSILGQNIVVALACADSTVRLLSVPLMPPSLQMKKSLDLRKDTFLGDAGHGSWNEQLITIPNSSGHRGLPAALSIAFVPGSLLVGNEDTMEEAEGTDQDDMAEQSSDDGWNVLIAACGSDQPTEFAIHRLSISADELRIETPSADEGSLWRIHPVLHPAVAVDLYAPKDSDSGQGPIMLLAETSGAVRIFDCRASAGKDRGRWLQSFHLGFETASEGTVERKTILDAKFVLGGQAIVVLTADGEWGVWNLSIQKLGQLQNIGEGLLAPGGMPTKFSLGGYIGGLPSVSTSAKNSSGKLESRSKLAPMTPGTRKVRQEALFTGSSPGPSRFAYGGIVVQPQGNLTGGRDADDMVVFWHGDKTLIIPSLSAHWQNKVKGSGNLFGDASGQIKEISGADLGGDMRNSVSVFPSKDLGSKTRTLPKHSDVLVSDEHGFVILSTPLSEPQKILRSLQAPTPTRADQQLLARGDLDVSGMDRILHSMSNGTQRNGAHMDRLAMKRRADFAT